MWDKLVTSHPDANTLNWKWCTSDYLRVSDKSESRKTFGTGRQPQYSIEVKSRAEKRYALVTLGLLLGAYFLIRRAQTLHSNPTLILGIVIGVAGLFVSQYAHPKITSEERKERFRELLDIRRPEETKQKVLQFVAFLIFFFGSLVLFLRVGSMYLLLDEYLYFGLLYALPVFLLATFLVPNLRELNRYPVVFNIFGRLGICIPAVALVFSLVMILNGAFNDSVQTRVVTCLGKRASFGKNPVYYVRARPWSDSERAVEIDVPKQVFSETHEGTSLKITTGIGRLGLEWIRRIDVDERSSESAIPQ